jgi:putative spermidine/putrescine transport system substrate-binding protein
LAKIDAAGLPAGDDGSSAGQDFVPGAIGPCWVGSIIYSQVIVTGSFSGGEPQTLADFFDTAKFPGQRALKRGSGKYNLEMALLADGVAPQNVYSVLATEDGLKRAFAKLESLGPNLIWYERDNEPLGLVENGQAAFATALNGQLADAARRGAPPHAIWDRQLYEFDAFGIPANDPQKDTAMDYIRFATGSRPLAAVAAFVPYGPARRSSKAFLGKNPDGPDMRPYLPTEHFATAFPVDDQWWYRNGARIDTRWRLWQAAH